MHVVSDSCSVTQSCPALCDSKDRSQASLSFSISRTLLKLMSIESVMPSNYLILCHPLLLLPSIFPRIRVFSNDRAGLKYRPFNSWFDFQQVFLRQIQRRILLRVEGCRVTGLLSDPQPQQGTSPWPTPLQDGAAPASLASLPSSAGAMQSLLLALLLLHVCPPGGASNLHEDLTLLRTDLALRLYRSVAAASNQTNLVLSPAGAFIPLELLQFGARGNTGRQLAQALGYTVHGKRTAAPPTLLLTPTALLILTPDLMLRLPRVTGREGCPLASVQQKALTLYIMVVAV